MDPLLLSTLIGAGGSLLSGALQIGSANRISNANLAYQKEFNQQLFDRTDIYNQNIWNREDTGYQRAVADLGQTGLSKTLALTHGGAPVGGASLGVPSGVSAPQRSDTSDIAFNDFIQSANLLSSIKVNNSVANKNNAEAILVGAQNYSLDLENRYQEIVNNYADKFQKLGITEKELQNEISRVNISVAEKNLELTSEKITSELLGQKHVSAETSNALKQAVLLELEAAAFEKNTKISRFKDIALGVGSAIGSGLALSAGIPKLMKHKSFLDSHDYLLTGL